MRPNWFVGIPVELPGLGELLRDLPKGSRGFHPKDLHMTVAFFGAMDPDLEPQVIALMKTLKAKPITATLGSTRALPTARRPSAFCLEIDQGHQTVCDWIASWRQPLLNVGQGRTDTRPPLPHITIARPLRKAGSVGIREGLEWLRALDVPNAAIRLDRLALYTWAENRRERLFQMTYEQCWPTG